MKRVLAIDTSCRWGGVALAERQETAEPLVVAELGLVARDSHAGSLIRWLDRLLALAGWERGSLDGYVATRGPGSFTGLRIGLGTLHGLALATDRPCGGVGTLRAMAEACGPGSRERAPVIDGGRGELFFARYAADGSPAEERLRPSVAPVAAALQACRGARLLPAADGRTAQLLAAAGLPLTACPAVRGVAAAAARLALLRPAEVFGDPSTMYPLYLRASDAELNLRAR